MELREIAANALLAEVERQTDGRWPVVSDAETHTGLVDCELDFAWLADSILQIPEIKEALVERRINAMSPSQFGAMLLDQLPNRPSTREI